MSSELTRQDFLGQINRHLAELWLAGIPAEAIRQQLRLPIGRLGQHVIDLGLPLRDHNRQPTTPAPPGTCAFAFK